MPIVRIRYPDNSKRQLFDNWFNYQLSVFVDITILLIAIDVFASGLSPLDSCAHSPIESWTGIIVTSQKCHQHSTIAKFLTGYSSSLRTSNTAVSNVS